MYSYQAFEKFNLIQINQFLRYINNQSVKGGSIYLQGKSRLIFFQCYIKDSHKNSDNITITNSGKIRGGLIWD